MMGESSGNLFKVRKVDLENPHIVANAGLDDQEDLEDIHHEEQLQFLDAKYLSGDPKRPLKNTDNAGNVYTYVLNPFAYCVMFILILEALERLSYYGVSYTQTSYLSGHYDAEWNAGFDSVASASLTQTSTAIAYTAPFVGAIIADGFIGTYWTIALFTAFVYIPGLLLIALTAYPFLLGSTFPTTVIRVALMAFYPIGAGALKSCVNVLGAQQFHPLQKLAIEKYYVRFYMFINIGALVGGIIIPIICQGGGVDVFYAYMIPVVCLSLGLLVFVLGTSRYVRPKPQGSVILQTVGAACRSLTVCPPSLEKMKETNGGRYEDCFVEKVKVMGALLLLMCYIVPFNIIYSQMLSVFIIQGNNMIPAGFIDASMMQNFDAISVLLSGWLIGSFLYPYLAKRGIVLHMMTKFAIGTAFSVVAILCAIIVDYQIHSVYASTGGQISVMWQIFSFFLIGVGEIFLISSAYEAAFKLSPDGFKAFGSAINLFFIGGVANYISTALLNACNGYFLAANGDSDLDTIQKYSEAHVYNYMWILFGIAVAGVIACLLPWSRDFYSFIESKSSHIASKN
uniref:Peptide transporter n=1 Tax=Mucochytrium quahogii TaxID=96639 RepID=A0A7S2S5E9_9STRA|mmetsp:Transcript_22040/g.35445  ORF Transcript_22040/g.35445 Transcript_22040/m.35445 type:complete len:568 (-) Transcript_22040:38-1741(-)|eukprot:CAMPEP_0203760720 /NCGR_PEP_ID=MMETSP0098-20131031/13954_1 /ASSEMBLY_ACC=CAM_ASM_000208 /TAXON_ID=96639 /ORGANISM=" , Strain NY0313808BC1" /LENGTH=567 /DNA_ID=CAMNT_0050654407 /DNA_START=110 /DNA_END=1813 /DNA_ORIENTATION=-